MHIIALDPGGTTGWASFEYDTDGGEAIWKPNLFEHFTRYGELNKEDHHYQLKQLLGEKMPNLTILERFEHRNNEFAELISCEYIGVVKCWAQQKHRRLILQGSSQAKTWSDNRKLEHLGLWVPGSKHAMDARRHLLYFLANSHSSPAVRRYILFCLKGLT